MVTSSTDSRRWLHDWRPPTHVGGYETQPTKHAERKNPQNTHITQKRKQRWPGPPTMSAATSLWTGRPQPARLEISATEAAGSRWSKPCEPDSAVATCRPRDREGFKASASAGDRTTVHQVGVGGCGSGRECLYRYWVRRLTAAATLFRFRPKLRRVTGVATYCGEWRVAGAAAMRAGGRGGRGDCGCGNNVCRA